MLPNAVTCLRKTDKNKLTERTNSVFFMVVCLSVLSVGLPVTMSL
jgi:hypothetical protein